MLQHHRLPGASTFHPGTDEQVIHQHLFPTGHIYDAPQTQTWGFTGEDCSYLSTLATWILSLVSFRSLVLLMISCRSEEYFCVSHTRAKSCLIFWWIDKKTTSLLQSFTFLFAHTHWAMPLNLFLWFGFIVLCTLFKPHFPSAFCKPVHAKK